jgi:hypothetical protein
VLRETRTSTDLFQCLASHKRVTFLLQFNLFKRNQLSLGDWALGPHCHGELHVLSSPQLGVSYVGNDRATDAHSVRPL